MEGIATEAASIGGHLGLGKLIYLYDDNRITIDGTTALSFAVEDKGKRFEAYGWHVQHVHDVNDLDELRAAYKAAEDETERPSLIVAHTHIAYPAPHAIDTAKAHGSPLGEAEVRATKEVLGWDPDETFVVPDGVYEHMSQKARGAEAQAEWRKRFDAWSEAFPEERKDWDQVHTGRPRPGGASAAQFRPARTWLPATPARRSCRRSSRSCRRCSAARPTWSSPRRPSSRAPASSRRRTPAATSPSASARTAWARSSTASRCTAASSSRTARPSSSSPTTCARPSASPRSATFLSSGPGRTTRSGSARTAPHTSRSSTMRRCARSRTSGSSGLRTRTRPPTPGSSRSGARTAPWRCR